jgi:hypothetical protein
MRILVFGAPAFAVIFGGRLLGFLLSGACPKATATLERARRSCSYSWSRPRRTSSTPTPFVIALSIASAIALIDDLDSPYRGFVVVSPQPMQRALAEISAP